jgi:aspartate dehydrogenase
VIILVIKVGLIGCGAIGTVLAEAIERKQVVCDELIAFDIDVSKAQKLKAYLAFPTRIVTNIDELINAKPKVIVEAAGQQAIKEYYDRLLLSGLDFIVMSTGALLDLDITSNNLHFPAGAIGGLDALEAASNAGIDEVTLISRKNPRALGKDNPIENIVYEGDAQEAAKLFPREMNVAATLALTVKPVKVKVKVVSDPTVTRNTHEIYVTWRFGKMLMRYENDPHPTNTHTSALAAWSAIRLLKILLEK